MRIALQLDDVQRVSAAMRRAPELVQRELQAFVADATAHLKSEVQRLTPTTAGTLRASIVGDVRVLPGIGVEGVVGTSLVYAIPVEMGTKPHMPPVAPLVLWAQQKLGVRGKEAVSAAWAIARSIARRGTEGAWMFRDAFEANEAQIVAEFTRAVDRIVAQIGEA